MNECRVSSPYVFYRGKKENGRFDFIKQLRGDLLSGTPVVQELVNERPVANGSSGTVLDIGAPQRNSVAFITQEGVFVEADQAVIVPIRVLKGKRGWVVIRISCDTTESNRNAMMEFAFETKE